MVRDEVNPDDTVHWLLCTGRLLEVSGASYVHDLATYVKVLIVALLSKPGALIFSPAPLEGNNACSHYSHAIATLYYLIRWSGPI